MPNVSHYEGKKLRVRRYGRQPHAWKLNLPEEAFADDTLANVYFLSTEELELWESGSDEFLGITAGFWQFRKGGDLVVFAPVIGMTPPFEIPPGDYFIVVVWDERSALSEVPVKIKSDEKFDMFAQDEGAKSQALKPTWRSRLEGSKLRTEYSSPDGEAPVVLTYDLDEFTPTQPPPKRPIRESLRDKVDPFVDLVQGIPPYVIDIRKARKNIWIAWWMLEDDFPVAFGAGGRPVRFLRQEIQAALAANPQLHVYLLIWWLNGGAVRGIDPAKWSTPATRNRLHISYHGNWPLGSHHQKFLLCDLDPMESTEGAVLWCRGWDGSIPYWDLHAHPDPNPFLDVNGNDHQPWHDSALRVVSQSASAAFESEFRRRWPLSGGAPPLPAPPPVFNPNPSGQTAANPHVHVERTRPGPQESWYLAGSQTVNEGFYFENQYLEDERVVAVYVARYLAGERGPARPIHGVFNICHPDVMSPGFLMARSARDNVAYTRAHTARVLVLRNARGLKRLRRPPGGWATVDISSPAWRPFRDHYHVDVAGAGLGGAGLLERAIQGILCLSMVTPSPNPANVFRPVYLHSKFAIVDGEYTLGSTNIAKQSFDTDSETDIHVPDRIETNRVMSAFFPRLTGVAAAGNLAAWVNIMGRIAASNYDFNEGIGPGPAVGLLTEFPYRD